MTPVSAMVMSVFGGLWIVFAIFSQRAPIPILCLVPIAIAALLVRRAIVVAKTRAPLAPRDHERVNKIVMYASAFEGVAIFVGINVLNNLGIANQFLPLLAVIVGLHFLPVGRYLPDWRYYPLAAALVAIGISGAMIPSPDLRAAFVGVSSALVLWTASIIALRERPAHA